MLAAVAIPLFVLLGNAFVQPVDHLMPILSVAMAGAMLIMFAHRENIRRLISGAENKFR